MNTDTICRAIGATRDRKIIVECQLPKGHSGNHGGMGTEWNESACLSEVEVMCFQLENVTQQLQQHKVMLGAAESRERRWREDATANASAMRCLMAIKELIIKGEYDDERVLELCHEGIKS